MLQTVFSKLLRTSTNTVCQFGKHTTTTTTPTTLRSLTRSLSSAVTISSKESLSLNGLLSIELADERISQSDLEKCQDYLDLQKRIIGGKHGMTLSHVPGYTDVRLNHTFKDEAIEITFNFDELEDLSFEEEMEDDEEEESHGDDATVVENEEEEDDDDFEQEEADEGVLFNVKITKSTGESMVFRNIATYDGLNVQSMSLPLNGPAKDFTQYNGGKFLDFPQVVQSSFLAYLNQRGINDDLASYISQYSEAKEQQEYVMMLEKAVAFTK